MIEREAGFSVSLERAPNGALLIPPDLFKQIPNIKQYVIKKPLFTYLLNSLYPIQSINELKSISN